MTQPPPIPEHLLDPANRQPFVQWLHALPVMLSIKWHLKKLWEDHTGLRLDKLECQIIRSGATPAHPHGTR